jgi:hypothetical protein
MPINPHALDQIELNLETAHAQLAQGLIDPLINNDAKLLASAIALAGSEIAVAIGRAGQMGSTDGSSTSSGAGINGA